MRVQGGGGGGGRGGGFQFLDGRGAERGADGVAFFLLVSSGDESKKQEGVCLIFCLE